MSYIGRSPQIGGYHKLDAITTDGSASYTMQLNSANFTPESANHLIVSVNGVIQAPVDSFTVSGSTITFASSLSVSDTIDFIMALGNTLDIGVPSDGTISTAKIQDSAVTNVKLQNSSITLNGSEVSLGGSATISGGTNTPAFAVEMTSSQTVSNLATVKVNFDNEQFDTDGAYDTTNKRFTVPSGEAGKYQFNVFLHIDSGAEANMQRSTVYLYVNGSKRSMAGTAFGTTNENNKDTCTLSEVVDLSVGDYVEVYGQAHLNSGSPAFNYNEEGTRASRFSGFKLSE